MKPLFHAGNADSRPQVFLALLLTFCVQ